MRQNTKKIGLLAIILTGIIGTSFIKDNEKNIRSKNYRLNNKIISQIQTNKYLPRKEAQNLINSLGLKHQLLYDSAKFNFYSMAKEDIQVLIKYKIPERPLVYLKIPLGNIDKKTLQQYLNSKKILNKIK